MSTLFFITFLLSILAILLGLVKPKLVIRWGDNKSRREVLKIYGLTLLLSFLFSLSFQNNFSFRDFLAASFFIIFFVSILLMLIGLIKPNFIIKTEKKLTRKDILKIFGISIGLSLVLAVMAIPPVTIEDNIEDARNFYNERKYNEAINEYNSVLSDWDEDESGSLTLDEVKKELENVKSSYSKEIENEINDNLKNNEFELAKNNLNKLKKLSIETSNIEKIEEKIFVKDLKNKISKANNKFNNADYREAKNIYLDILNDWRNGISNQYSKKEIEKKINQIDQKHSFIANIKIIGKGTINQKEGEKRFYEGEVLNLEVSEKNDENFLGWMGDIDSENNNLSVKMNANKDIIAKFEEKEYELKTSISGKGNIRIEPSKENYNHKDKVTLTAEAANGWVFDNWVNDISGDNFNKEIEIIQDTDIRAVFSKKEYSLDVDTFGDGEIRIEPDRSSYRHNELVKIIANPNDGWILDKWDNYDGENTKSIEFRIQDDKNISAIFREKISNLNFNTVYNNSKNMTDAQFDQYKEKVEGKRISWTGYVVEVKEEFFGDDYEVLVDMHDPNSLSVQDVYLNGIKSDLALNLNKKDRISFEGNINSVNKVLGAIAIDLKNVKIR